jgi:hypothetical protein
MPFYLPLTLGVRRTRPAARDEEQRAAVDYEEHPAARVLEDLRRAVAAGQTRRPWFVLGEPGAGKSTLLERWFDTWSGELPEPRLGSTVPVLVRLRELRPGDLDGDPEAAADRLWREHGVSSGAARSTGHPTGQSTYREGHARAFRPIWLLDGLDELDERLREDAKLFERLVVLPGAKLITCRIAVFEAMRDRADAHKEREFEIVPLKPPEQETFLAGALASRGHDPGRAKVVHNALERHVAIRALAGNPLTLSLIAEVGDRMTLPATRAAFYREAVAAMWHRKLSRSEAGHLLPGRERALTELAKQMALEVEHTLVALVETSEKMAPGQGLFLRDALERAGLLSVDERRGVFGFVHPTFQEFYLARALEPDGLRQLLERHWAGPRYEETLALLVSILLDAGRAADVDEAVCWLLEWGAQTHRRDPRLLWQTGRSPVRVVLHLLRRSGTSWEKLPETASWLKRWLRFVRFRRIAVAADSEAPGEVLADLARNRNWAVRMLVAGNSAAPAEVVAALACDDQSLVRIGVAQNRAAPAEVLAALARDDKKSVREHVAENSATPTEVLAALARHGDKDMRRSVAGNSATPGEVLAALARDDDKDVRRSVAWNSGTPGEVLAALTRDDDKGVRLNVARNGAAPAEALAIMVRGPGVSVCDTWNSATAAEVFAALAGHEDNDVRGAVAVNPAMPADMLAALVRDNDENVRWAAASNFSVLPEVLAAVAGEHFWGVRNSVALNRAAPGEVLAKLARDPEGLVRCNVGMNPATPTEVLTALARDDDKNVRRSVAQNSATPAEVLALLARDNDVNVLIRANLNPNILLEDIAPLGTFRLLQLAGRHLIALIRAKVTQWRILRGLGDRV